MGKNHDFFRSSKESEIESPEVIVAKGFSTSGHVGEVTGDNRKYTARAR
jgi:hypothetical protein